MHTYVHTYVHSTYICTYIHIHAYMHTSDTTYYIDTCTNIYTCINIQVYVISRAFLDLFTSEDSGHYMLYTFFCYNLPPVTSKTTPT